MSFVSRGFLISAIFYGIAGIALGLFMAITHDHGQTPTHAHVNLIGWVSFVLFTFYYNTIGDGTSLLARIHFWLAQISAIVLFFSLAALTAGMGQMEPLAAVSSIGYAVSFLVFAWQAMGTIARN